ncbi:MAG: Zn-dependent hydrolase, partial [Acidobacteriota bacterium]
MHRSQNPWILCVFALLWVGLGCAPADTAPETQDGEASDSPLAKYRTVTLTTDLPLSESDRAVLPLLIEASKLMDDVFWKQAYGDRDELLGRLSGDQRAFAEINYGPWDRLDGDAPFVDGVGEKPKGA